MRLLLLLLALVAYGSTCIFIPEGEKHEFEFLDVRTHRPPIHRPRPTRRPPIWNFVDSEESSESKESIDSLEEKVQEIQRFLSTARGLRPRPRPPTGRPRPRPPTGGPKGGPKGGPGRPKPTRRPPGATRRPKTRAPPGGPPGPPHPTRAPGPRRTRRTPGPRPTTLAPPVSKFDHFITSPSGQRVQEVFFEVLTTTGMQILRRWLDPMTGNVMAEDYVKDMNVNYPPEGMGGVTDNQQIDEQGGDYQGTDNQQIDSEEQEEYPPNNSQEQWDFNNGNY